MLRCSSHQSSRRLRTTPRRIGSPSPISRKLFWTVILDPQRYEHSEIPAHVSINLTCRRSIICLVIYTHTKKSRSKTVRNRRTWYAVQSLATTYALMHSQNYPPITSVPSIIALTRAERSNYLKGWGLPATGTRNDQIERVKSAIGL